MDILRTVNSWLFHSLFFSCEWSAMLSLFYLLPFAGTLFSDILTKSVNKGKEASRGSTFCVYRARVLMFPRLPQPVTRPEDRGGSNRNRSLTTVTIIDSLDCATQRNKHLNKRRGPLVNNIHSLFLPYLCEPISWHWAQSPYDNIEKKITSPCMFLTWWMLSYLLTWTWLLG